MGSGEIGKTGKMVQIYDSTRMLCAVLCAVLSFFSFWRTASFHFPTPAPGPIGGEGDLVCG